MKYLKKFESFVETANLATEPQRSPATPERKTITPTKPGKAPVRPSKPSPIPRKGPSTIPSPAKATAESVADRFIDLMVENGESVKKYTKLI